jgi:hypothetical protein
MPHHILWPPPFLPHLGTSPQPGWAAPSSSGHRQALPRAQGSGGPTLSWRELLLVVPLGLGVNESRPFRLSLSLSVNLRARVLNDYFGSDDPYARTHTDVRMYGRMIAVCCRVVPALPSPATGKSGSNGSRHRTAANTVVFDHAQQLVQSSRWAAGV